MIMMLEFPLRLAVRVPRSRRRTVKSVRPYHSTHVKYVCTGILCCNIEI